jgi:hypothetical protein
MHIGWNLKLLTVPIGMSPIQIPRVTCLLRNAICANVHALSDFYLRSPPALEGLRHTDMNKLDINITPAFALKKACIELMKVCKWFANVFSNSGVQG